MRTYVERFSYKHPTTEDFIEVVNEVTGDDMTWFFDQWLRTTEKCDYEIASSLPRSILCGVHLPEGTRDIALSGIRIRRNGNIVMPFDLLIIPDRGAQRTIHLNGSFRDTTITIGSWTFKAIIDPDKKILETNRWNNHWPRKRNIKPIFDFPDFDAYQVFYYPYVWYQTVDGIQVGGGLQGRQFLPIAQFHGSSSWDYHAVYGIKSKKFLHAGSYAFPVQKGLVAKIELGYNRAEEREKLSLTRSIFKGLFSQPEHTFTVSYEHTWIGSHLYRMDRYWELANLHVGEISYIFRKRSRRFTHYLAPQLTYGTGDFSFTRVSFRISEFIRTTWNNGFTVKFFGGYAAGSPPRQYRFYPSGSLFPTGESPFAPTYEGMFSPLEHWHIEGGPDLKGYYGRNMSGKAALTMNLCTPYLLNRSWFPSTFFFDAGALFDDSGDAELLYDAGVTINIGPLFMDFPLWVSKPGDDENKLAFRWTIGLSPSTVSLF
jgi:hypothetical protein